MLRSLAPFATALALFAFLAPPLRAQQSGAESESEEAAPRARQQEEREGREREKDGVPTKFGEGPALPPTWAEVLKWREIGPCSMGGRVTDLAVVESQPWIYWVATATGGVWKTENAGVTFEAQFQHEGTGSVGAIAVAPSDPRIVWVGTGESNVRNSVSWGDGVYKSEDGGKTWKKSGLEGSFQVGALRIDPRDPNVVYVAAMGRMWGPNEERGLFKTSDGGKTWEKILYADERTGCIDVILSPADPNVLLAALYERERDIYCSNDPSKRFGPGSGIFRSADGGRSWQRLGQGLPSCQTGRVGFDWSRSEPNVAFAIIESAEYGKNFGGSESAEQGEERPGNPGDLGLRGETADDGGLRVTEITADGPAAKAGVKDGDVLTKVGETAIEDFRSLFQALRATRAGDKVALELRRGEETVRLEATVAERPEGQGGGGGLTAERGRPFSERLGGQRANVQDRQGEKGYETGGVYRSDDAGLTWKRLNSINPRPYYFSEVRVDPKDTQNLYVLGISLHKSTDGGKRFTADAGTAVHADHHAMWIDPANSQHVLLGCDGGLYESWDASKTWHFRGNLPIGQFYDVAVDMNRPYRVFGGLQDNGSWGGPSQRRGASQGPENHDFFVYGSGDGFVCAVDREDSDQIYYESQNGGMGTVNLRTGQGSMIRPSRDARGNVFNWKTPFLLSAHNSRIYYCAGSYVFRSLDRGRDLRRISPRITADEKGSATALAESPKNADFLIVGTDDGKVQLTRDGGANWIDVTERFGLPGLRHVDNIECSHHEAKRAWVVFDSHRSNEEKPYVYVTEDAGETWQPIHGGLPQDEPTRCLREDPFNPDLLLVGTEFGAYASLDRGTTWTKINAGQLPTVPIHDFAIHPRDGEAVAATHGRSFWILDLQPLRELTKARLESNQAVLMTPDVGVLWARNPFGRRTYGNERFYGSNPPSGLSIWYALREKAKKVELKVTDLSGRTVQTLRASREPGLHRVAMNPRGGGGGGRGGGGGARPGAGAQRGPGTYRVVLVVDGVESKVDAKIIADPNAPAGAGAFDEEELFDAEGAEGTIEDESDGVSDGELAPRERR
jgi:photosystem II stability/assembly factor-like uncharacterized protein